MSGSEASRLDVTKPPTHSSLTAAAAAAACWPLGTLQSHGMGGSAIAGVRGQPSGRGVYFTWPSLLGACRHTRARLSPLLHARDVRWVNREGGRKGGQLHSTVGAAHPASERIRETELRRDYGRHGGYGWPFRRVKRCRAGQGVRAPSLEENGAIVSKSASTKVSSHFDGHPVRPIEQRSASGATRHLYQVAPRPPSKCKHSTLRAHPARDKHTSTAEKNARDLAQLPEKGSAGDHTCATPNG